MRATSPIVLLLSAALACGDNAPGTGAASSSADAAGAIDAAPTIDAGGDDAAASRVIVFDNSDGTFVWTPFWVYADECCYDSGDGAYLDLTLDAASQTGEGSLTAIRFFKEYPYPISNWGAFLFQSWYQPDSPAVGAMFSADEDLILEGDLDLTIVRPLPKSPGDTVGPDDHWVSGDPREGSPWGWAGVQTVHLQDDGWETGPTQIFLSAGLIGVKFDMADGVHYGFVELEWDPQDRLLAALHFPVRWGYNPAPGVGLVIPP
jgi:hypothetical protein